MNVPASPALARRSIPLRFHINESDIARMDYWLNEAPMCDPARANAIVFALERIVLPGTRLQAGTVDRGTGAEAEVNGEKVPLPDDLADWWLRALRGHRVGPITTTIFLPAETVPPPAAPSPRKVPRIPSLAA